MKTRRSTSKVAHVGRGKDRLHARDEKIRKQNSINHERLALAIVEAVKLDPYIQHAIVLDWCRRHGLVLASAADADAIGRALTAEIAGARGRA